MGKAKELAELANNLTVSGGAVTVSGFNYDNIVDSAPGALNTLNELAEALNDDDDAIVTINTALGTKAADNAVVHLAGTETISGGKTFSNVGNTFNGHLYYSAYDANGNHYPHFLDGSSNSGTIVQWRQYYYYHLKSADSDYR